MGKPKEWWIEREQGSNRALLGEPGEIHDCDAIHVIEYLAYETAIRERDGFKYQVACLDKELTEARAACETIKQGLRVELSAAVTSALNDAAAERTRSAKLVEALKNMVRFGEELCEDVKVSKHQFSIERAKEALAEYSKDVGEK